MFCENCGHEVAPGTKFCSTCGSPVKSAGISPASAGQDPVESPAESPVEVPVPATVSAPSPVAEAVQPEPVVPVPVQPAPVDQSMPAYEQPAPSAPASYGQPVAAPVAPAAPAAPVAPVAPSVPAAAPVPVQAEGKPAKAKKEKPPKPAKVKKEKTAGKKKKLWIIPLVAVLLVGAIGAGGFFFFRQDSKKTRETKDSYEDLCDMTSLGAQSYLYARVLTERLLETDLATADPVETENLFRECIAAWEATGSVTEDMQEMAQKLADSGDTDRLSASSGGFFSNILGGRSVFAASSDEADNVGDMLPPEESIEQCTFLSEQISVDTTVCLSHIRRLQEVYNGRQTDYEEWTTIVQQTSVCFTNVVFLSGEVVSGETTTVNDGQPVSVYQISTEPKPDTTVIENTNILIDIGSRSSTFVMSNTDCISINSEDLEGHMPAGETTTLSMNTHPSSSEEVTMTFHSVSFTTWFLIEQSGGYTITRGVKDEDGIFTPPEVEIVEVIPERISCPIDDWTPPIGAEDITNTRDIINGEEIETDNSETEVDSETLDEQLTIINPGIGDITVSVMWGTYDDVDLHVITPNDNRIYYANKTADGGTLDVDMNACSSNLTLTPIENIYFPAPGNGHYEVYLRDYRDRTEGMSTHYLVRVQIGDEIEEYEGDIDVTGTEVFITEFDYGGNTGTTNEPLTEENLDILLDRANAGEGDITVSLAWNAWDDVDLHMETPDGSHIYYSNKAAGGGILDVDANAGSQRIMDPVENIYFAAPENGTYRIYIRQFNDRSDYAADYIVRVTIGGQSQTFTGTIDGTGTEIEILEFEYGGATPITQTSYTDHTYAFIGSEMTWAQARSFASSMGGHLLVINDEAEQEFIETRFPDTHGWIGFVNTPVDCGWVNGDPVDYTNFCVEQPENYGESDTLGFLYTDMQWGFTYNTDREYHYGFYIEWDEVLEGAINGVINEETLDSVLDSLNAGSGNITISVLWDSDDDIDLHVFTPDDSEIYYGNRTAQGGTLDVDANTSSNMMDNPVENIYFPTAFNGQYWVYLHDYADRSEGTTNYIVRITVDGESATFTGTIDDGDTIEVTGFEYTGGVDESLNENTLDDILDSLEAGEGDITVSMLWDNSDDLDLHIETPDGSHIYYGNRQAGGGELDIDANAGSNMMDNPVENIYFETPANGEYRVWIRDYSDRNDGPTSYIVRITVGGQSQTFTGTIDNSGTDVDITTFTYGGANGSGTEGTPDESTLDDVLGSLEAGTGEITISMLWDCSDDLDLHVETPDGSHVYYGNRQAGGGELDIDANTSSNMMDNPVENIYFASPATGSYRVYIKDYSDRNDGAANYIVRVTVGGQSETFTGTIDGSGTQIDIITFNYGGSGSVSDATQGGDSLLQFIGSNFYETEEGDPFYDGTSVPSWWNVNDPANDNDDSRNENAVYDPGVAAIQLAFQSQDDSLGNIEYVFYKIPDPTNIGSAVEVYRATIGPTQYTGSNGSTLYWYNCTYSGSVENGLYMVELYHNNTLQSESFCLVGDA